MQDMPRPECTMLTRAWLRLRALMLRRRLEREMQAEMAEHLERATARLMARGMSAHEARREAGREFGNVPWLQEQARDARGWRWPDALLGDLRFALRHFVRRPGPTLTIVAVLSIGISLTTVLFSYLRSYSIEPPPGVERADDLVRIRGSQRTATGLLSRGFSYDELQAYRALTDHFTAVAGWATNGVAVDVHGDAERQALPATAAFVTDDYFAVLGLRPVLGAGLSAASSDAGSATPVAVISHAAWDRLFGRRADVVGATLSVNGVPVTIVGVAPPRYLGMSALDALKLWLPLEDRPMWGAEQPADEAFRAVARLRPGVSLREATAAVQAVAARAAAAIEVPARQEFHRNPDAEVVPLAAASGDPNFDQDVWLMRAAFIALGLLVLLVTCTNVSALLTGLAMARRREIAVRLSMGGGRARIIRQLLTESVLLASVAGAVALGVVLAVNRAILAAVPVLPITIGVSVAAALFTFGTALAVGIVFGLSPALHATRMSVSSALKDSTSLVGATRARLQRALVVAQIAFTQPLIVGVVALLLMLSGAYQRHGLHEAADRVVTLRLRPVAATPAVERPAAESLAQRREEIQRLRNRLAATPGVASVVEALRHTAGLEGYTVHPDDRVEGGFAAAIRLSASMVAPGHFTTLGMPIVLGREFGPADAGFSDDRAGGDVPIVIGSDLAHRLWPGATPLGRRLQPPADSPHGAHALTIVGVVDQPADAGRAARYGHRVYVPPDPARAGVTLALLIRTRSSAQPLLPALRAAASDELPGMAIAELRTIADMEAEVRHVFYLAAALLAGGGALALFIAAIGLYAVAAFSVGQRTAEIAVRVVVGARPRQIVGQIVGDGLRLSAVGVLVGLPLSLLALRTLLVVPDFLPTVPLAPVAAIAAAGVLAVATAATFVPARRASLVDPALTLRRN
jgi:predicted permease